MMDALVLTADQILSIPISEPERLFKVDDLKGQKRALVRRWHPDRINHPIADKVVAHINVLFDAAERKIHDNTWKGPNEIVFTPLKKPRVFRFRYRTMVEFELGKIYTGKKTGAYILSKDFADLYENASKLRSQLRYASDKMKDSFAKILPDVTYQEITDVGPIQIFKKTENVILLSDLLRLTEGSIDPVHVAWIGNCLFNLACFFEYNRIVFNGYTPENLWVSPKNHAVFPVGWWYARKENDKLLALPGAIIKQLPAALISDKIATSSMDRYSIKALLIQLLGDETGNGAKLLKSSVPEKMVVWLRQPPSDKAVTDYSAWKSVLEKTFGARKFVELKVDLNKIYGDS
ncbi:MAG: hypothetical protein QXN55_00325 [Candidatus Nitrosotenuis sp.]